MHQRYGRHGPHAWFIWHQRRYHRLSYVVPPPMYSSAPVENTIGNCYGRHGTHTYERFSVVSTLADSNSLESVAVTRVFVPTTTERIIFIIMSDDNAHEAWENPEEIQMPHSTYILQDTGDIQKTSPIFNQLRRVANRRAIDDASEIRKKIRNGRYILLDREGLDDRADTCAREYIPNDHFKDDPNISYQLLVIEYINAYKRGFDVETQPLAKWITEIKDDSEKQLRSTLSKDRLSVQSRDQGDWHLRDLVLIRILQIYYPYSLEGIDIISVLLERHALIDKYYDFVRDTEGKNEVTWPDPDSFRLR